MKVLVFDTETGGLNPRQHSIFSVGALVGDLDTGQILETFEAYHKLDSINDYVYTPKSIEIHGITPEKAFNNGLSSQEICDKFTDLWYNHGAAIIGGHNIDYDIRMMSHQLFKCDTPEFEANFTYRKLDTLPVIRLFTGNDNVQSGSSLGQAVKLLNINMDDHGKNKFHAALFDSICCFRLMAKFRKILSQQDIIERLTK